MVGDISRRWSFYYTHTPAVQRTTVGVSDKEPMLDRALTVQESAERASAAACLWPDSCATGVSGRPYSSQVTEEYGGVDGTRTRGLCRDRATIHCKPLKLNGVGGHGLML
jgi:hypothetical protein